jgi:hypothetical protein
MHTEIATLKSVLSNLGPYDQKFANDLIVYYEKKHTLTPKQQPWVAKLIAKATTPKPVVQAVNVGGFSGVVALFKTAKQHLKFPKVILSVGGTLVKLSLAGAQSKAPGSINLVGEGQYPNREFFGTVSPAGEFKPSFKMTEAFKAELAAVLTALGANPAKVAKEHGKLLGVCCFCNTPIGTGEDQRSVAVGFGPVCADHYGLKAQWQSGVVDDFAPVATPVVAAPVAPVVPAEAPKFDFEEKAVVVPTVAPGDVACLFCETAPGTVTIQGLKVCPGCAEQLGKVGK